MLANLIAQIEDPTTFVKLLTGAGITGLLGFLIWLFSRGTFRFGREDIRVAQLHDRETERLERELTTRTADRDRWVTEYLNFAPIVQKQGAALEALKDCVEELTRTVEGLAEALKRKDPGQG
jgi:hypothetical protein